MKFKRIAALALSVALLFSAFPVAAQADGEGNIDHGGGSGMGGAGESWWNGDDGVRVTVVRASDNKPVSWPVDFTNYSESDVVRSFIPKSKLHYRGGMRLQMNIGKYKSIRPDKKIPKIITEVGTSNLAAIKSYFCSKWVIKKIAQTIGTSYAKLTDGKYKLLLEPVAYFFFHGRHKYAMTATEAALYDEALGGGLRAEMVSLTHQQLPLSMFLQRPDLGYPAFHGNKKGRQSDSMIISQLGLGVVKFKDDGSGGSDNTVYRCNTDVITSVYLSADDEVNPNSPASVTFHILGGSYTVNNIVIPAGESQLVWVKWHTPSKPQTVNISVTSSKGWLSDDNITAKVEVLTEKTPPDPTVTDRNDSFKAVSPPNHASVSAASWTVWNAYWVPNWAWKSNFVWVDHPDWQSGGEWVDSGKWVDEGKWNFNCNSYSAFFSAEMSLLPDDKDPTANGKQMKSGYGVKNSVSANVSSTVSSWVTGAQTAITYFPEFQYKKYWRVLDLITGGLNADFAFKKNPYSTYGRRVHFTPIWYPDVTYTAYTYLEDVWTPTGMLSANLTDSTQISGNVYDDWHVGPEMVK